ncbi:MAG: hypothetical protein M1831_005876 [Alyxoria varia]|nr:MAG: hypothetical protein M1831_005876 [Alyxoria varia]
MSIPNEALQKLLQEIEQKAAISQQQIQLVKGQIASKNRDTRMLELTSKELGSLPTETNVYEGVGKMFVQGSTKDMNDKLSTQKTQTKTEIDNLNKKLHYLETTAKNSQDHINQMLRSGGKA